MDRYTPERVPADAGHGSNAELAEGRGGSAPSWSLAPQGASVVPGTSSMPQETKPVACEGITKEGEACKAHPQANGYCVGHNRALDKFKREGP